MVVVRESPNAKVAPDRNSRAAWPPVSPLDALLSSPGGRKRWQERQNRANERTPSPSPIRKNDGIHSRNLLLGELSDDEEEDEEILKLKLERIDAKLKLKQIQRAKQKGGAATESSAGSLALSSTKITGIESSSKSPAPALSADFATTRIQVPGSPKKSYDTPQDPVSPARRRLGIASQPDATTVSLKRARDGTRLYNGSTRNESSNNDIAVPERISFGERIAQRKLAAQDLQTKEHRIAQVRSKGFNFDKPKTSDTTLKAPDENTTNIRADGGATSFPSGFSKDGSSTLRSKGEVQHHTSENLGHRPEPNQQVHDSKILQSKQSQGNLPAKMEDGDSEGYDEFSQIHLKKRYHPHVDVAREMRDKKIYTIPKLLKEVVSPHYDPPDCETDFVVFAILASKSNPLDQKSAHRVSDENKPQEDANAPRNKFMVLHLTDLKWQLDCYLFGTGFDQFWKLTPGTLLAILNPAILPPKGNQHSGRFSLKLSSCEDKVMEIGVARDLGYCTSIKKDGQPCGDWIDKRRTDICEFHLNMFVDRNRKHRMEVNSMWRGQSDGESRPHPRSKGVDAGGKEKSRNQTFHAEYGRLYSVPSTGSQSAASLLDADDMDALYGMSREEASRRRIAAAEKERDLARKLGQIGSGPGAEYLRIRHEDSEPGHMLASGSSAIPSTLGCTIEKPSVHELGLFNNRASEQHLSPAKDRKRHFGIGAVSSAGTAALGWGGARKGSLLQDDSRVNPSREKPDTHADSGTASGNSTQRSSSPRKRARFALKQGIREPGRESLGMDLSKLGGEPGDNDDDDDLEII